ncbi:MAG: transposase [Chloroflexi bacterium]|nr:transposase [Chloroflexota bacterium]
MIGYRSGSQLKLRAIPDPIPTTLRVLGADEWAFRRGRHFGTILVDLERHRPVDLLPEASFATWLGAHRGVEVISRDRGGAFADGARRAAPEATQVADRFHLLTNLGEGVMRVLRRHGDLIRQVPAPGAGLVPTELLRPDRRASRERTRCSMRQRFEAILRLKAQRLSIAATARALGLHQHTIGKYWSLQQSPERTSSGSLRSVCWLVAASSRRRAGRPDLVGILLRARWIAIPAPPLHPPPLAGRSGSQRSRHGDRCNAEIRADHPCVGTSSPLKCTILLAAHW